MDRETKAENLEETGKSEVQESSISSATWGICAVSVVTAAADQVSDLANQEKVKILN